jgi:SAM-dependent methyltransferase
MLRRATRAPGVRYVACEAESLPFGDGAFDLVLACGSIDWVDRGRFLPRAARLTAPGGWLVSLDFGDTGRSPEVPGLEPWYTGVFEARLPRPPASDPIITADEATSNGFGAPRRVDFVLEQPFTAEQYGAFLMTESNAVAAVEYGSEDARALGRWLVSELRPLFARHARRVTFGGYIQALRRT